MALIWILLAAAYLLSPYDLLPDFLAGRGWLDDIVVLLLLYRYLSRLYGKRNRTGAQAAGDGGAPNEEPGQAVSPGHRPPHQVLGVSPDAGPDEIHQAYRQLAAKYHPDKVAHLGEEFRRLAEQRFKEIQQAYEQMKR